MDGTITVSTDVLKKQAEETKKYLQMMEEHFSALKETINKTANYWIGEAGEAQRKQYTDRISKVDEMLAGYTEHVANLEKIAGIYEEGKNAVADAVNDMPESTL